MTRHPERGDLIVANAVADSNRRAACLACGGIGWHVLPVPDLYTDPECRYAKADDGHVCARRDGQTLRYGEACHAEARAQLFEQARNTAGPGPKYRYSDPAVGRAKEAHDGCPTSAMEHGESGARCSSCGVSWRITTVVSLDKSGNRRSHTGYLTPPTVARPSARLVSGLFD